MKITELTKDVRRLLLEHWSLNEIEDRLDDPEYFFEQVVMPRLEYLRRSGEEVPRIRMGRTPLGELRVLLIH